MASPNPIVDPLGWLDAAGPERASAWLVWLILALVAGAVAATWWVETDVVVHTDATLIPSLDSLPVQSQRTGWVTQTRITEEGTRVQQGEVLVELDARESRALVASLEAREAAVSERIAILERMVGFRAAWSDSTGAEAASALERVGAELREAVTDFEHVSRELATVEGQRSRRESLLEKGLVSTEDLEGKRFEAEQLRQTQAQIGHRITQKRALKKESVHARTTQALTASMEALNTKAELSVLVERRAELRLERTAAELDLERAVIRAPQAGVVMHLRATGPGRRVEAGETVAWIAPEHSDVRVELVVPSRGAAVVHAGMPVSVKLDAYPFQDFGVLHGVVTWVAPDAERTADEQRSQVRRARVRVVGSLRDKDGTSLPMSFGMHGSAEVVVRRLSLARAMLRTFRGGSSVSL